MLYTPCQEEAQLLVDTGFGYTLSLIGGKYKMVILYWLQRQSPTRFNELQRRIGGISYKTLAATLKELERDGLISRTEYPQVPPKVEYALTARGRSLLPVLDAMCAWGRAHREVTR
nr:helix-turn-helix domain-containing protein [uncultured Cardiobacterium sp.]